MKCEIIRDLMPLYIDNLTGEESNIEFEEHIKECSECSEIYNQMKTEVITENIEVNRAKIKPFKKLNKRLLLSILITLVICLALVASYFYFFGYGWALDSADVKITYTLEDDCPTIQFESEEGKALTAFHKRGEDTGNVTYAFRQCFISFIDDRGKYPNTFTYGQHFIKDENDEILPFTDDHYIILKFKDKTETIYWKDVVDKL